MQLQNLKKAKSFFQNVSYFISAVSLMSFDSVCTFYFQKLLIYPFHFIFAPPPPHIPGSSVGFHISGDNVLHLKVYYSLSLHGSRVSKKVYSDSADELSFYSRGRLCISAMYRVSQ